MTISGIIILWSGSIANIPRGWLLCDGTLGTPNLKDNFVIGAGDTFAVDDTGGNQNHNHDFTADLHAHQVAFGSGIDNGGTLVHAQQLVGATATGTTDNNNQNVPFYALAYIMKR